MRYYAKKQYLVVEFSYNNWKRHRCNLNTAIVVEVNVYSLNDSNFIANVIQQ